MSQFKVGDRVVALSQSKKRTVAVGLVVRVSRLVHVEAEFPDGEFISFGYKPERIILEHVFNSPLYAELS